MTLLTSWTRAFLDTLGKPKWDAARVRIQETTRNNARKAQAKFGIPEEMWLELSVELERRVRSVLEQCKDREASPANSLFMAGFAIGWHEGRQPPSTREPGDEPPSAAGERL